ncbi:MAG: hypothetical protein J4478_03725 [Candidatus Diapherotrites archaeon]|uniref:Uncharacterized protein n=1 Tax=Candidatus Iainarchaeum sp. TaxID=3101447 RepID=A0A7J4JTH2_9ARCH|nr:hypothetical protein [Candidatus Diapherotrites archaeon]HIH21073.1 hypothetical protein [Candidatus Diapherotrites archaeon]HIH33454.1 hypothetical protein [Candidatus Diapherotrites archaeon]
MILLQAGEAISQNSGKFLELAQGNWGLLATAIAFIIIAIIVIAFLKQILVNSVLGIIAWALLQFVFQVKLNFWVSLIVSIIFGIAGVGVLLLLHFLGITV